MNGLWTYIPIFILVIIVVVFHKKFDTEEKVDKGIELFYWKLSYRRKFIRTIWMFPIFAILIILRHITFQSSVQTFAIVVLIFILLLAQAIYNYKKWKNEK